MIVKMQQSDGTFRLFDEVQQLIYTKPNTYLMCPPMPCKASPQKLERFIEGLISSATSNVQTGVPKEMDIDEDAIPLPERHIQVLGVQQNDLPSGRKIYFNGEIGEDKYCFKYACFIQHDEEMWIYTDAPIYICNDSGKTIEVIK